ncbi:translation elongation factor Ts [Thermoleophilum album]|uniref:translation elongation factor Ts n=1 Tax=Thermoleophilum album TaxID=29539 RepID=UPI000CB31EC8|nr:translation elongation factor Ts [Thermoleophilum album]MCL6441129.1 translation elongation factor Ts [Thermoleophilum sp.]WDT94590.1 translation elongation factor Ts [Thermoleophilum album]GBD46592.1 Elongation factor Ts [bacterium HR41]
MATITARDVKELRERTGAGMMDCKAALEEAAGDIEKAVEILRVRGQAKAAKRAGREAAEGYVASYVHADGKIGVLVEVDCETDFVARSAEFREFAQEVALHVAWAAPRYVSEDEVPAEEREAELRVLREQAAQDGKPPEVQERIAQGRLNKWLDEVVLLRQEHANRDKHGGKTIEEMRAELAAKTGENIVIRRFARIAVGE